MGLTITEALAEIKTVAKRIEKKGAGLQNYLVRQDGMKDPLEREGGSVSFIQRELQSIADLEERIIRIRAGIARANADTTISIAGVTRSIADWLVWRREVAPGQQLRIASTVRYINEVRAQAAQKGFGLVNATVSVGEVKPTDLLVNVSEAAVIEESDRLAETLGALDGQLSLKNATVSIEV